jgi:hypothetical protein
MIAIGRAFHTELLEFLMSKGASVEANDEDGLVLVPYRREIFVHLVSRWNVIHYAVNGKHDKALKWLLEKLPKETFTNLLTQTTNDG